MLKIMEEMVEHMPEIVEENEFSIFTWKINTETRPILFYHRRSATDRLATADALRMQRRALLTECAGRASSRKTI